MARLLIIDDDVRLGALLERLLVPEGFHVTLVTDGLQGMRRATAEVFDLIVLDVMLPGMDGFEVLRRVRAQSQVPVLMLTAKGTDNDRVVGLELGADDYLAKPFSPRELLARLRAVMRRYRLPTEVDVSDDRRRAFRFTGWELNLRTRRLHSGDGRQVALSNHEYSLLVAFCSAPQRVLSRDQLLSMSRLHGAEVYDRTVDVQVLRLRRKIEADPLKPGLILTERGAGYRFDATVDVLF